MEVAIGPLIYYLPDMKASLTGLLITLFFATVPIHSQIDRPMIEAARKEFDQADADLNRVYKEVLAQLSPKGVTALKESQRAWLIFRDKTAEAYGASEEGGSNENVMFIRCSAAITRNRIKELKALFLSGHYPY